MNDILVWCAVISPLFYDCSTGGTRPANLGQPATPCERQPVIEKALKRFLAKTRSSSGCWLWTGAKDNQSKLFAWAVGGHGLQESKGCIAMGSGGIHVVDARGECNNGDPIRPHNRVWPLPAFESKGGAVCVQP